MHLSQKAALAALALALLGCATPVSSDGASPSAFTIAVVPDTQNYVDYRYQPAAGSRVDGGKMFLDQMHYIAENLQSNGGDIAFVSSVGDVWQNSSIAMDSDHEARGFKRGPSPFLDQLFPPTAKTREVEMPLAKRGYDLIAGKTPFSVVPGNHDYDAVWTDIDHPPKAVVESKEDLGLLHIGGLDNFRSIFGADSPFFKDKPWYVASNDGGADSAQIFEAGGYRFLHIGLQFDPPNATLAWAEKVIAAHPGLPTIISTHNYLNGDGERKSHPTIDLNVLDPDRNTPEMVWDKLVRRHDQIFMVLCGHQEGQALRIDRNDQGHSVYQILSDYQGRGQTLVEAGMPSRGGMGDGWLRLMRFDLAAAKPTVTVRTYSTHYQAESAFMPRYAKWYRAAEKPKLTDADFLKQDNFMLALDDFAARFAQTKR